MTIGFVGLGRMGSGMAHRLTHAGEDLVVFDVDQEATRAWSDRGIAVASSLPALARRCDVVITSLPGPDTVRAVALGNDGVAAHLNAGGTLIETTTSSPSLAREIHAVLNDRGASMLDAPVSGGPAGAHAGELAIWVGGDRRVFDAHARILKLMGSGTRYVGPIGSGTVVKLVHNLTVGMHLAATAEGFSLGVAAGIEPSDLWQALERGSLGRRSPLDMITSGFMTGNFEPPGNALRLFLKDLRLATAMAMEYGVPLRIAGLTFAEVSEALARGWGDQDSQAFMKLQLERAGVTIAVSPADLDAPAST